ncbi:hypothetical protein Tco_1512192, partial [Tanacetum coccineum]
MVQASPLRMKIQKFLRSLPSAWSQVSLIMRTKPGVDSLNFDDLYNNIRVFENDVKGSTASSSSTQNVAFIPENTNNTNDVSTAYSVSNTSGQNSQRNGLEMAGGHNFDENEKVLQKDRHLDAKKKFVMYPRFISIFLDKQLVNVPVPLDHFPVNALTSKVFSFMVKKGKHFSGKVTPLFASMLVQSTEDEGATSERPSQPQPTPSPPHPSEANIKPQSDPSPRPSPTLHIPDSILEVSGGNHGGQSSSDKSLSGNEGDMTLQSVYDLCIALCTQVTDQAKEIKHLKAQIKKLKKQAKPGRKSAKSEPSVHKDPLVDELDDDEIDNMDTEDAQDVGRTREALDEEKEGTKDAVSTKDVVSIDKEKVSSDRSKDSNDKEEEGTDKDKDSTVSLDLGIDDRTSARS